MAVQATNPQQKPGSSSPQDGPGRGSGSGSGTGSGPGASSNSKGVAWLVAGAFFMEMLDSTIITTALPEMARSFGVRPADMSIGMSAYLLALAVFIPISGWVADRYGSRKVFGGALVLFTLASILCGLAQTLPQFTAARVLQGLGGAMMVPVGRLAVLRATPKTELIKAIAIITWPGLAAPVIGPLVGGVITTYLGWHWIFFLNVPLGVIAILMTLRLVHGEAGGRRPFDVWGFILTGVGCSVFMYAMDLCGELTVSLPLVAGLLALALVALVLSVWHLRRVEYPLVDLSPLRYQTFAVTMYGGSLFRIAIGSAPFLLPLMFQVGFGLTPVQAGSLMLALFAGNLVMKPGTAWVMRRFGFRRVLVVNGLLVAVGFVGCAMLGASTPYWLTCVVLFFCGMCRSMQFTALNTLGFADVPRDAMTGATTLFSACQQLNAGIGIAFGAIALRTAEWATGLEGASAGPTEFRLALLGVAALAFLAIFDSLRLRADAGAAISGHNKTQTA
ncbi:MFS transporter [Bordetella sp. LUAb4]|uniref:MFS transporter n=1 Tax=Bordetella sp. LUAb4 TaxID=2843195 RepID=UPI001E34255A|nr:MFS transporter [Bordetella sp. LUAb4]